MIWNGLGEGIGSLPDTKLRENISQKVVGGDLSRNLSEEMKGSTDIHGKEIIGDFLIQTTQYI
jgi:hypothetical protein